MKKQWEERIAKALVGRKIVEVRYLNDKEVNEHGWHSSALIMLLDDGTYIYPSSDDEGNDAGALFTNIPDLETIPVI